MDTICPQGTCPRLPFHTPSKSIYDRVYTEEAHTIATSTEDSDSEQTEETSEETTDHVIVRSYRQPLNPAQTQQAPSGESSNLLVSESPSPYRSQSPMDTPVHSTNKQYKHALFKQKERKPSHTVYVTLDIFEQGQGGSKLNK